MPMLLSLALPIVLSGVALFFASFLSWMVFQLHKHDWKKLDDEDKFLAGAAGCNLPEGSYMFPGHRSQEEMKSEVYQRKYNAGPRGVMTILPKVNMGQNLGLTVAYFLVVSFLLAYLGTMALPAGSGFLEVFRFISTAAFMTFLAAIVQHAIWFRPRIIGHVIESVAYAAITGAIFAAMWPAK
jgi:hypothetical protein